MISKQNSHQSYIHTYIHTHVTHIIREFTLLIHWYKMKEFNKYLTWSDAVGGSVDLVGGQNLFDGYFTVHVRAG